MSEISHLFSSDKELSDLKKYNVFSIGCGPCSDLFGITNYLIDNKKKSSVKYFGFDLNEFWRDIHSNIKKRAERSAIDVECKFIYKDIFDVLKKEETWPDTLSINIVIFHYLLSDMVANRADIRGFFVKVYRYILSRMKADSFIIINDINHYNTRDYFDLFLKFLETKGDYKGSKYHFENNNRWFFSYGSRHPSNSLVREAPSICYSYNFWEFCSSSQMLIRKNS